MTILRQNTFGIGDDHNYLIGGNVTPAFALGEIGSFDDFFLVGAVVNGLSPFPMLTGNILDAEGNVLFRLVQNRLEYNPADCSIVMGENIGYGYEIRDQNGTTILQVQTRTRQLPRDKGGEEFQVTTIAANFYDKSGQLVFRATSGEDDEMIESRVKSLIGIGGLLQGYDIEDDLDMQKAQFARMMLQSGGVVHEFVTGEFQDQEIRLDGKFLFNVTFRNCKLVTSTGNFRVAGRFVNENCKVYVEEPVVNVLKLLGVSPAQAG